MSTRNQILSFEDFDSQLLENVSTEFIVDSIVELMNGDSSVGRSNAIISFETFDSDGNKSVRDLIVDVHRELGSMLYLEPNTPAERISVGDRTRLTEEVENGDGNLVCAGNYIDNDLAIQAIREFCNTGHQHPAIQWVSPADLPPFD